MMMLLYALDVDVAIIVDINFVDGVGVDDSAMLLTMMRMLVLWITL
jgi:hypothetical protein